LRKVATLVRVSINSSPGMTDDENEFIPTRQSLLERLRQWNDQESWQLFFDTYWKLIYRTARKAGLNETEAEDAVQETVISVARQMPDFQYRPAELGGSFKQWLLRLTKWRICDQLRKRQKESFFVRSSESTAEKDAVSEIPDPLADKLTQLWNDEWEQNLLGAALERVKGRVEPRDYQVFYLSTVKNWSGSKVARNMKVSLAHVYTIKHRVSKEVKNILSQFKKSDIE
jgi:RNA polymerase sigma factor (sigma-70 family)